MARVLSTRMKIKSITIRKSKNIVLLILAGLVLLSCLFQYRDLSFLKSFPIEKYFSMLSILLLSVYLMESQYLHHLVYKQLNRSKTRNGLSRRLIFFSFLFSSFFGDALSLFVMIPITLDSLGKEKNCKYLLVHTLVLQVLAGEIGSFLFPYTSLSSLYLFLEYGYSFLSFLRVSFIFFFFGGIFLLPYVLIFQKEENTVFQGNFRECSLDKNALIHFCLFSLLVFLCYLRILPILLLFPVFALYTLIFQRRIFLKLDAFLFFFLFLILLLKESTYHSALLSQLFGKWILGHETSRGFILSEIITRLPASVLLSSFSTKGRQLIVASILSTIHPFAWNYSSIMAIVFLRRAKLVNLKLFLLHYLMLHGQMLIILLFLAFFTGNF